MVGRTALEIVRRQNQSLDTDPSALVMLRLSRIHSAYKSS